MKNVIASLLLASIAIQTLGCVTQESQEADDEPAIDEAVSEPLLPQEATDESSETPEESSEEPLEELED